MGATGIDKFNRTGFEAVYYRHWLRMAPAFGHDASRGE